MPEFLLYGAADLKENEKKLISAGKTKILVLRHQGKLSAFQSKCPHAGGPLEKGAICNGSLVCPWHMGTFRIPDGRLIEPPAMDSLETYPLRIEDSKVVVTIPSPKAAGHQKGLAINNRQEKNGRRGSRCGRFDGREDTAR
jgi:nitrite reductase/ring-hydroxylating ferredoxin subunit